MVVNFVRFKATDGVELQGWLSDPDSGPNSNLVVIHLHGMSGNGYENYFLDNLRENYNNKGVAFFSINTRGRGVISDFRKGNKYFRGGSCYEIFEESIYDIEGAINYLKSIYSIKTKYILQGHSLGCSKVVNYWINKAAQGVIGTILLAPTDMVNLQKVDVKYKEYLEKATKLVHEGNGTEIVGLQYSANTPISAQSYLSISEEGCAADIYMERDNSRSLIGRVGVPTLVVYGTKDIGIIEIDGSIEAWKERFEKIKHPNTILGIIKGSAHGFQGYEKLLIKEINEFMNQILILSSPPS